MKGYSYILAIIFALMLIGCSEDVNQDEKDSLTITFTSSSDVSVNENQISALTLITIAENSVTYSIREGDSDSFDIDSSSGVITFKIAPDYETKTLYSFTAVASDGVSETYQEIVITILNLDDTSVTCTDAEKLLDDECVAKTCEEDNYGCPTPDDTEKPIITLNGDNPMSLIKGSPYVEAGATALDNRDENITVTISGNVNIDIVESYSITYKAEDEAGNKAELIRVVNVVLPPQNNFKISLSSTEKIAGYEITLQFLEDTPSEDDISVYNVFLGVNGRSVSALGPDIDEVNKLISFGAFSFGSADGVSGEFEIFTLTTMDALEDISIIKTCIDKDANSISCDITISK